MKKIFVLGLLSLLMAVRFPLYGKRIVTMAPALTETVFALGEGDNIVGNTKFCNYPEEAKKITRIGGLLDVNLELLISAKPDVIILYPENYEQMKIMEGKARLVTVKHTNLKDIMEGIAAIAKALDVEDRGGRLLAQMKGQMDRIRENAAGKKKMKTLLVIGRNPDKMTNMYIVGKKDFLSQLVEVAGGVNAYDGGINYPSISMESVVAMNPDAIIELSAFHESIEDQKILDSWGRYSFITAVKNKKILIIRDALWLIPGPRVPQIAQKMHEFFY